MNDAIALVFTAVLFVGGVVVLGLGALAWGHATQSMVRARAHNNQADSEQFTMQYAQRAVEEAKPERTPVNQRRMPTAEEVAMSVRYESEVAGHHDEDGEDELDDTMRNEGIEEKQQFGGGLYNT